MCATNIAVSSTWSHAVVPASLCPEHGCYIGLERLGIASPVLRPDGWSHAAWALQSHTSCNHAPQVFEQLFQAYEQQLPRELADKAESQGWLDPREVPADACPAERQLQISYNQTPQVPLQYSCCALGLESRCLS